MTPSSVVEWWEHRRAAEQARAEEQRARREADLLATLSCSMRAESVRGLDARTTAKARLCFLCGGDLPAGMRRWCGARCSEAYWDNHGWGSARFRAIALARVGGPQGVVVCDDCGGDAESRRCGSCRESWPCRAWADAQPKAYVPGHYPVTTAGAEVNHVEPRVGQGYHEGCHHHQTNLQVLCHTCHVAETTRQVRERRAALAPVREDGPSGPEQPTLFGEGAA